ncbi:hypothetical protein ACLESD_15615 [Pyxidicoccus sp. 3LFB2]
MKNLSLALSAVLALSATSALAGESYDAALCVKNADGSGYCYGTYRGFRNHWSPKTYVEFLFMSNSPPAFYVNYQQTSTSPVIDVTCTARTAAMQAMWPLLISNEQYFSVVWNSTGECTYATVSRSSKVVIP